MLYAVGALYQRYFKGKDMYWVALTPLTKRELSNRMDPSYGWRNFETMDKLAEQILTPYGITVVNANNILAPLKEGNPKLLKPNDIMHWCTPGPYSVPHFMFEWIMHLHVMKYVIS